MGKTINWIIRPTTKAVKEQPVVVGRIIQLMIFPTTGFFEQPKMNQFSEKFTIITQDK